MNHLEMKRLKQKTGEIVNFCYICKKWVPESKMRGEKLFGIEICFTCYRRLEKFMNNISGNGIDWIIDKIGKSKVKVRIKFL